MFCERHVPYDTQLWKTLRGDLDVSEFIDGLSTQRCCQETGAEYKIASELNSKSGYEFQRSVMSLRLMLEEARAALSAKGYFTNVESEGLLRQCTGLECVF